MKLDQVLQQFPTTPELREHARRLKNEAMARWVASMDNPDRRNHIDHIRGEVLSIAADIRQHQSELDQLAVDAPPLVHTVIETDRVQVAAGFGLLQAILDFLEATEHMRVFNAPMVAAANRRVALADSLARGLRSTFDLTGRLTTVRELNAALSSLDKT